MEFPTMASVLMVVRTAIELKVFDIIADAGPGAQLSATETVSYIPTSNPKAAERLNRMLRLLSASGFLINTSSRQSHDGTSRERTYSHSKMSHYLLRNTEGFSIAIAVLQADALQADISIVTKVFRLCTPFSININPQGLFRWKTCPLA
ncbi:hypothetical protein SLEP1_g47914 [Rubroshorea leprosula]|uniref:O-methyltransferase dimerisation domain-containing protein n=1 Tax=Rubroshorea leprosula TaxID=152421 RepID=A0AAV5LS69_9ROSI|nr:hypothetical protein SLEP1_g47914 [Rubroshorea leprosula]